MRRLNAWEWLALLHLAAVVGLMLAFRVAGERSLLTTALFFSPRIFFAAPLLITVPALLFRRARLSLLLPALTAAFVLGPLMGLHLNAPRATPPRAVKLLTYHVKFGTRDPATVAREIAAVEPDIVALQAVSHRVLDQLNLPGFEVVRADRFAVASRYPLRLVDVPPASSVRIGPSFAHFAVESRIGTIDIFNVHPHSLRPLLQTLREPGALRTALESEPGDPVLTFFEQQLAEIAGASRAAGDTAVIAGDFNLPEGGSLHPFFFGQYTDAFAVAGTGYGYTFPSDRYWPWMRLDRVLLGGRFTAARARVVGGAGSDHRALLVEIAPR